MPRCDNYNKRVFQVIILSFCIIFGAFILSGMICAKESIEWPFLLIEIACGGVYIGGLSLSTRIKNIKQLLFCILFSSLLISFATRIFFLDYYNAPFGIAVDSYRYDFMVIPLLEKRFSLLSPHIETDDLGYPYILYQVYKMSGNVELGIMLMVFINSLFLIGSSYLLYRLAILLGFSTREAMIAGGLYGFNPFLYITSSVGLKEVIFCFLIISSFYYMFKWKLKKKTGSFVLCVCFILSTIFFRSAICLMLLICLGVCAITTDSNKKKVLRFLIICGICSPIFANYILESFTGNSFEKINTIAQTRNSVMGSGITGSLVQMCAALIGPFPNFFRLGQYALLFSGGILLKSILNIFLFIGVWKVIQNLNYKFYPLVLYSLFGIISVILAGVALDMRFVITFFPSIILVSLYAIQRMRKTGIFYAYLSFLVIVTVFYNVR